MNISTHRISLDVAEAASHDAVTLRQGENAHRLVIAFRDNGADYPVPDECYAVFSARKSDGTQLFNNCTIENNTVIYDLTAQTTAAPGRLECEIRLFGAENKLIIAPKFSIFVQGSTIDESGIESTDEFSALNELISQAAAVTAFRIKGYFDSAAELSGVSSPTAGDAYGIGTEPPYEIYAWDAVNGEWVNHGTLQGEKGEPGEQGVQGTPGEKGEPGESGVYVGSGTAPASYSVQIDPEGSADELVTEAPNDGKQYARKNKTWAEVEGGGIRGVQLAGTKLTPDADGTVNIPFVKGIASSQSPQNSAGVVIGDYILGHVYDSGRILHWTSAAYVDNRGGTNTNIKSHAVTLGFLDYAVKKAMCDPIGTIPNTAAPVNAAWTDSEKTGAWKRLNTIKTVMDSVAVAGAQYYLGTQSAVSIVLPSNAETGQQISAVWYNGSTAATLSVTGTAIGESFAPTAYSRSKAVFEWDGSNWCAAYTEISLDQ